MRRPTLLTAAAAAMLMLPGTASAAGRLHATLIDVHVFHKAGQDRAAAAANCSNAGPTSAADFAYTGWKVAAPTTAYLTTSTVPAGLTNVAAALRASFNAWANADAAVPGIAVRTGGTATAPSANGRFELFWARTSGNAIAITYTWRWSDGTTESDTVFGSQLTWFTAAAQGDGCVETRNAFDVRNIATHEFGHTYGMGHPAGGRFETMYAYGFTGETLKWSLGAGDRAGIRALY